MAEPRVPGEREPLALPCGETIDVAAVNLGQREFECRCGATHAVVTDAHPPSRFLPAFLVETLREAVDTTDRFGEFGTPHLMATVMEEFPDAVVAHDASGDGRVGYAMLWVADFDARRLHEVIVELVVELMDHALGHVGDADATAEFEDQLAAFDVAAFVDEYRRERDWTDDGVGGYGSG